jgi:hypothetical protein
VIDVFHAGLIAAGPGQEIEKNIPMTCGYSTGVTRFSFLLCHIWMEPSFPSLQNDKLN